MKPAACYRLSLFCALFAAAICIVNAQTNANQKSSSGSISGNVKIKGKAASGIVVSLRRSEANNPYETGFKAKTDDAGNYVIRNVPAGNYDLAPIAPAYVYVGPNSSRTKQVVLAEGENVSEIDFSLVRGGVITGKVTDADGRAVIQERVSLYRADLQQPQQPQQRQQLYPSASVSTDDRGIYRFFGVMAGQYKVAVGAGADVFPMSISQGRPNYSQVFHPDVSDYAKASVIEVGEASEANNIDITVGRAQQTFAASGQTVDDKGLPMANQRFGLQRILGDRPQFVNPLSSSNARGEFVVEGLTPGKYEVFLMPEPNNELRIEALAFDVVDQDVNGLVIKLQPGASISGTVVVDSDDRSALAKLDQLQVQAYVSTPEGRGGMGRSASGSINPDGSFRLGGLPAGTASMGIGGRFSQIQTQGFNISRVERDGVLQPRGIEIREGEQLTGVRIVLSYGIATLRGEVKFENGTLPPGANIQVRLTKVGEKSSNVRPPRLDSRNHFIVENVPPGAYEVTVYVFIPNSRTRPTATQPVTLVDHLATDIVVTVDLSGLSAP